MVVDPKEEDVIIALLYNCGYCVIEVEDDVVVILIDYLIDH